MDIRGMEGAPCLSPTTASSMGMESYLTGMRAALEQHLGASLGSIGIKGVHVRNVTATTGDAEVQYSLPASVVGNNNWVSYGYQNGKWKVTSCHAPIGGDSQSACASNS